MHNTNYGACLAAFLSILSKQGHCISMTQEQMRDICVLLMNGNKIGAIKAIRTIVTMRNTGLYEAAQLLRDNGYDAPIIREFSPMSLRDSKDAVEHLGAACMYGHIARVLEDMRDGGWFDSCCS